MGYTYFGVLFIVALISLALSGAALVWKVEQQREKERELLFIGQQYINAIASYYHAAPGGNKKYPRDISELLRDPRYPFIKRHLRKPWRDPMTLSKEWGLVRTKQGGIAGIYSLSSSMPLKQAGFGLLEALLGGKSSYQQWQFIYIAATDTNSQNAVETGAGDASMGEEGNATDDNAEPETGEELLPETSTVQAMQTQ
jgi:type II secretory pathway pseudopilin PulG